MHRISTIFFKLTESHFVSTNDMYSRYKKRNTPIYFNTNYRTEMKLLPVIKDYCLLQFETLKFFLLVSLHGGGVSTQL